ncbi:MAG: molybdopterin molybdenumtransferase MoeA [Gammaproteobacteria bacterium]|nr:molybdopterin molybdenumtransferase MoeA [Gammaproteobacteria bacterium]
MNKKPLISVHEARKHLAKELTTVAGVETVSLDEAQSRILAEDIPAGIDVPGYDNSAMDGFALNTNDFITVGKTLPVSQVVKAGTNPEALLAGSAARIFTGAPIPKGADAIVLQEDCDFNEFTVKVKEAPEVGQHIRCRGHDIKAGSVVFKQGRRLMPQDIGLLASLGTDSFRVYKRLRVAIINAGDELVEPGQMLQAGQIYESNSYTLKALLGRLGFQCIDFGIVGDELEATRQVLARAAEEADCIISSGGVSVGDADFVKAALQELGEVAMWKLALKPGKPFTYGKVNSVPFFGLPGNPVAVFVTFALLVKPYLLGMQGMQDMKRTECKSIQVAAGFTIEQPGSREEYLRVCVEEDKSGKQQLIAFSNQGSSVMSSLSWADGLARIPCETLVKKGDLLDYLPFEGLL